MCYSSNAFSLMRNGGWLRQCLVTFPFLVNASSACKTWFRPEFFLSVAWFNCWFSFAPVFQWCCSAPQGSPGVGRGTFLSSPHLCFVMVFVCSLFVSRGGPLVCWRAFARTERLCVLSRGGGWGRGWDPVEPVWAPPSIFILTFPGRCFCCGSLLLLVLAVRVCALVRLLCWWRVL